MTTRDRTEEFNRYRARYNHGKVHGSWDDPSDYMSNRKGKGKGKLMPGEEEGDHVALAVAPGWTTTISDVEYEIEVIQQKMKELEKAHKQHILPDFEEKSDKDKEISVRTAEITAMIHKAHEKIKKIGMGNNLSAEESKMKSNIQAALARQLQDLSGQFRRSQRDYLNQLKHLEDTGEVDPFAFDNKSQTLAYVDPGFTDEQIDFVARTERFMDEYENEAKAVMQSILDLNQIFKDISIMVVEQGSLLDRIDYNLEHAEISIDSGINNLVVAHQTVKNTMSKKCMILLCVAIMGVMIILFIKFFMKIIL